MQAKIEITLKSGHSYIVPHTAEASQRRMNSEKIDFIRPVGGDNTREAAIEAMVAKKKAEIEARIKPEAKEVVAGVALTMESTKDQIMAALESSGVKFNPNHRKQDLFNVYVSSRSN